MKYGLYVSYNCGWSYDLEKESDNLDELVAMGKKYDDQMLRWSIEEVETGKFVGSPCKIHAGIISFLVEPNELNERKME